MTITLQVNRELDARGLRCPLPLLKAKQAMHELAPGAVLCVLATDPGSQRDFRAWSVQGGHELLLSEELTDGDPPPCYRYVLRKKHQNQEH